MDKQGGSKLTPWEPALSCTRKTSPVHLPWHSAVSGWNGGARDFAWTGTEILSIDARDVARTAGVGRLI